MDTYLNVDNCNFFTEINGYCCKKLNDMSEIRDHTNIEYQNLYEEMKIINSLVLYINKYIKLIT